MEKDSSLTEAKTWIERLRSRSAPESQTVSRPAPEETPEGRSAGNLSARIPTRRPLVPRLPPVTPDEVPATTPSELRIPEPFPPIHVPEGFALKTLADEDDLRKTHRVLHRGFDHPGEPPEEGVEGRRLMQSAPSFRKDLTIVVTAPDGRFVSFCGMWYESVNRYALIEPLATDPDHRRMGLAKAAVWEGIRRCADEGAEVVYVGSDQLFYKAIGFKELYKSECWIKKF